MPHDFYPQATEMGQNVGNTAHDDHAYWPLFPVLRRFPRSEAEPSMKRRIKGLPGLLVLGIAVLPTRVAPLATQDPIEDALDAFWAEVSRTVEEGDFEGYAATYHDDAVLVSGVAGESYPIAQALDGWKQGFLDTRTGKMKASVEFRFTRRIHDQTTAHETGIFRYAAIGADGQETASFVHFEALLVFKDGWKMVMEYQKSRATEDEWNTTG